MNPFPVGYSSWDEKWRDASLDPTLQWDADPDPLSQTKNSLKILTKFYIIYVTHSWCVNLRASLIFVHIENMLLFFCSL
jgi:hypothetical protein